MILLIDNYDSFSYNLYQMIGGIYEDIKVIRNDELTVEEIEKLAPEAIIISPGPKAPKDAGVSVDVVKKLYNKFPILGICLGHQSICEAFGATVSYAKTLVHGKASVITVDTNDSLFDNLNKNIKVARYHSLAVLENTIPDTLKILSRTIDDEVMAIRHIEYPVYGLQFHPESIMTPDGAQILKNFIKIIKK